MTKLNKIQKAKLAHYLSAEEIADLLRLDEISEVHVDACADDCLVVDGVGGETAYLYFCSQRPLIDPIIVACFAQAEPRAWCEMEADSMSWDDLIATNTAST